MWRAADLGPLVADELSPWVDGEVEQADFKS